MSVQYVVKQTETIFLPSHRRTCYFNFGYPFRELHKYSLVIPDMEFYLYYFQNEDRYDRCAIYYYPVVNGKKCYSPFLNTTDTGSLCLGDYYKNVRCTKLALNLIYTTIWSEASLFSYVRYLSNSFSMHEYKLFIENWEKTGHIDVKVI